MAQELDAEEVEHLALQQVGVVPKVGHGWHHVVVAVHLVGNLLHRHALMALRVFKDVYAAEAFLAEILADNRHQVVEMLLILQLCHLSGKVVKTEYLIL